MALILTAGGRLSLWGYNLRGVAANWATDHSAEGGAGCFEKKSPLQVERAEMF